MEDDMGNLRQNETLLEENIKLKRQKEELNSKVDKVLSEINEKMSKMAEAIEEINKKEPTVIVQNNGNGSPAEEIIKKNEYKPAPFIPTADTSGMKVNVATIEKKKRKTDLTGTVDKLSKLKKSDKGEK